MTQTPRDWQKDMDFSNAAERWLDMIEGETTVFREYGPLEDNEIAKFTNEADAIFFIEAREALPYWLQEAKTLQEIASGRGREALRLSKLLGALNDELTASEERADAAEAREQRLKELIESIANAPAVGWRQKEAASILLSTLYPDTPAPTPEIELYDTVTHPEYGSGGVMEIIGTKARISFDDLDYDLTLELSDLTPAPKEGE